MDDTSAVDESGHQVKRIIFGFYCRPFSRGAIVGSKLLSGNTLHFDYTADTVASGLISVQLATNVPCTIGVLTSLTEQQGDLNIPTPSSSPIQRCRMREGTSHTLVAADLPLIPIAPALTSRGVPVVLASSGTGSSSLRSSFAESPSRSEVEPYDADTHTET